MAVREDKDRDSGIVAAQIETGVRSPGRKYCVNSGPTKFSCKKGAIEGLTHLHPGEKEAWNMPNPETTEAKAANDKWESEKADLVKDRNGALLQAKVT